MTGYDLERDDVQAVMWVYLLLTCWLWIWPLLLIYPATWLLAFVNGWADLIAAGRRRAQERWVRFRPTTPEMKRAIAIRKNGGWRFDA